jgi:peptidoglycan-N-acetylglucosamine deacetylase
MIRGLLTAGVGAMAVLAAQRLPRLWEPDRLPLDGGYAPAGNPAVWSPRGGVRTVWHVPTDQPWVALTFDDGPEPQWTPQVLDVLDSERAVATFFVVGERLREHAELVRGRYDRHEVGNHTWSHVDLAERDERAVRDQLERCHRAIREITGREATLLRPPWGHTGGSTLTVADEFGYDLIMWSQVMPEAQHRHDPAGLVQDVTNVAAPGSILLAHDVGDPRRLVTLDNLALLIRSLRAKGLELVTVSRLRAAARPAS